jgi:hypothetical protein
MRDQCGFDPLRSVERLAIGGRLSSNEQFDGVIVIRGVSGAKTLECIAKATEGEGVVSNERGILSVDRGGTDRMVATIVASSTLVVQTGGSASAATLDAIVRSGSPLRRSKGFMTLFDRREPNASAWGMISGNSPLLAQMAQAGAKPRSVDGTVVLDARMNAVVRVGFANQAEADQVRQELAPVLPMASGRVEKLEMMVNGSTLRGEVIATEPQLRDLMGMFGM